MTKPERPRDQAVDRFSWADSDLVIHSVEKSDRAGYFTWNDGDVELTVEKFNSHHGDHGHFAAADGAGSKKPTSAAGGKGSSLTPAEEKSAATAWFKKLSGNEKDAVINYTHISYQMINGPLRKGEPLKPPYTKQAELMDKAIVSTPLPKSLVVYRGVGDGLFQTLKTKEGSVFVDHGFISTTINKARASQFGEYKFHITVPAGHPAGIINGRSGHPGEHEVILPRGSSFKIDKIQGKNIHATVVATTSKADDEDRSTYFSWQDGDIEIFSINKGHSLLDSPFSKYNPNHGEHGHFASANLIGGHFKQGSAMGTLYNALADGSPKKLSEVHAMLGSVGNPAGRVSALKKIGDQTGKWEVKVHKPSNTIQMTVKTGGQSPGHATVVTPSTGHVVPTIGATTVFSLGEENDHSNAWFAKLNGIEKGAVKSYTGHAYSDINNSLRASHSLDAHTFEKTRNLDAALAKASMPATTTTYRGTSTKVADKMKVGEVFVDHGFISTSFNRDRASGFASTTGHMSGPGPIMHVTIPKGHPAGIIGSNSSHPHEREVLLPRGTFFKVTKIDGLKIHVTVI